VDLQSLFAHHLELPGPDEPLDRGILPSGGGVCALTDDRGRLIQTLAAQNLRRFLALRLEPPREGSRRRRTDLRAVARRLWWQPTHSVFETWLTYLRTARLLAPQSYRQELAFGPVWFARVDPDAPFPRWVSDKYALTPPVIDVGPFWDRASCRRFIELLEDLFDLCRHYEVLKQAPHGQACAYKEMGKCPAPCDGSISMDRYRDMIAASVDFARGGSAERLSQLEQAMSAASTALQFERAARIREQILRAKKILAADGRLQLTPDGFRYLVIQRGGGTSRIKPFFVDRGSVSTADAVMLRQIDRVAEQWTDKMVRPDAETGDSNPIHRSECIWLVSHFLAKGDRAPGLFLHESQLSTPGDLAGRITERFGKRRPQRCSESEPVDPAVESELE